MALALAYASVSIAAGLAGVRLGRRGGAVVSVPVLLGVALLGGAGAVLRRSLDGAISARSTTFGLGTLAVNLTGAFALGVLAGAGASVTTVRLLGAGLLGAYTTFSAWMLQGSELARRGERRAAVANLAGSLLLGLALVWAGRRLGAAL